MERCIDRFVAEEEREEEGGGAVSTTQERNCIREEKISKAGTARKGPDSDTDMNTNTRLCLIKSRGDAVEVSSQQHGPEPSPSRSQAGAPFHMHPLLSYTRLRHTPISYDVAFTLRTRYAQSSIAHDALPTQQ